MAGRAGGGQPGGRAAGRPAERLGGRAATGGQAATYFTFTDRSQADLMSHTHVCRTVG